MAAALVIVVALVLGVSSTGKASGFPVINIASVVSDSNVTITGVGFPVDQTFTVRMGVYGTLGMGGVVVGSKEPASGSSFTISYPIPASLVGAQKIAIRLDSPQGYYAYNWFYNNTTAVSTSAPASTTAPSYIGVPTFSIASVTGGSLVTILTNNFPAGQSFTVRMGEYGTAGVNGTVIGVTSSSAGGSFNQTYLIPANLAGLPKIAIRLDSPEGYYAYNWFYNTSTLAQIPPAAVVTSTPSPVTTPLPITTAVVTTEPPYTGFPSLTIMSVVKDSKVTIHAANVPAGETITLLMGEFGTAGVGGVEVTKISSGAGGDFTATYLIPATLYGRNTIAIRMETSSGFFAYNWFYNN